MITTATEAMNQAPPTISYYLKRMIRELDGEFGIGYAKKNPDLLATLITSCVDDFRISHGVIEKNQVQELLAIEGVEMSDIEGVG